jgi:hypothetical protein
MAFSADTLRDRVAIVTGDQANFMTGETVYVSGGPRVANREDNK